MHTNLHRWRCVHSRLARSAAAAQKQASCHNGRALPSVCNSYMVLAGCATCAGAGRRVDGVRGARRAISIATPGAAARRQWRPLQPRGARRTAQSSRRAARHAGGEQAGRQRAMPVMKEIPAAVTGHVPVKIWTDQVEESAEQQLAALAACPFVFHHVAAMPDVHYGLGATIGSVFATRDVLLPTAVGVDIGCFTGDTPIPLLNGRDRPLQELAEAAEEVWVWAITPSQCITAARATARQTRSHAPLVRVTLDNGEAITCTPDHRFMARDGAWAEAAGLAPGTALMPLYKEVDRDGYVLICQPYSGRWQRAHWAI